MNDKQDELNDMMWERYRAYLESKSFGELLMDYVHDMTKKQLMDIIQEADPVGKGDGCYED